MMLRYALAFVLPALAAAAVAAPRDWSAVAAVAASPGSYVIGNPAARVKLIEYVSYTCPHCRHFTEESAPVLDAKMVRSGSTSVEIRNMVHDKLDLVAATLARCAGSRGFPRLHKALFSAQADWLARGAAFDAAQAKVRPMATPQARMRAYAEGSGLSAVARGAGMAPATLDRCFADLDAANATIAAAQAMRQDVAGTPAFEINGTLVGSMGWAELEPKLRAAGAR